MPSLEARLVRSEVMFRVERVVFRSSGFVIVRKIGIAADVARELTNRE